VTGCQVFHSSDFFLHFLFIHNGQKHTENNLPFPGFQIQRSTHVFNQPESNVEASSPAIANAIYHAVGIRIKDLPITPEKILEALREKEK